MEAILKEIEKNQELNKNVTGYVQGSEDTLALLSGMIDKLLTANKQLEFMARQKLLS